LHYKFADDLLLLAKEETVEQLMEKLFVLEDTVEWKRTWEETKVIRVLSTNYDRSTTTGECGIIELPILSGTSCKM